MTATAAAKATPTTPAAPSIINPVFIGVDPGISGALALYRPFDGALVVKDLPTSAKKGSATRREVDASAVATLIKPFLARIACAVVEHVGAMPFTNARGEVRGQGAAASFAFGKATGVVLGVLATLGIRVYEVRPGVWKGLMGLSSDKDLSRHRARQIFLRDEAEFSRKKDNGRAEAALLAYFAAERFGK